MNGQIASPTLYIFSGLPGSGKSTLAQGLAEAVGAAYLRIDTIEQAIRDLCSFKVEGEGYRLAYRVAADNLRLGISVVSDSCNPIELTRDEWNQVAIDSGAAYANIEIVCSDLAEHQRRVETRKPSVVGLALPTWEAVVNREYEQWKQEPVRVDTAGRSIQDCLQELLEQLELQAPD